MQNVKKKKKKNGNTTAEIERKPDKFHYSYNMAGCPIFFLKLMLHFDRTVWICGYMDVCPTTLCSSHQSFNTELQI